MKRAVLVMLGILVFGFAAIQLVPVQRTNPPVLSEPPWDSPQTRELAQRACFDCHSNETVWPAYAYVAPVSWLVAHDTNEGRQYLNFSEWNNGGANSAGEVIEAVAEGQMPMANYVAMHPQARLTAAEKQQLIDGFKASLVGGVGGERGEGGEGGEREGGGDGD